MQSLDKQQVRSAFAQASVTYDYFASLQRTVATELLKQSGLTSLHGRVLDLGCGTGYLTQLLHNLGGFQDLYALDIAYPMLQQARQRLQQQARYCCADMECLPLQTASIDWLFSSLALQWCTDLPATLADCQRVLTPGGKLLFATFGPQTLQELKLAWATVDNHQHVNQFHSQAELQTLLSQAGWQAIRIKQQLYSCHYPSVIALMRELKGIGAHNVARGRKQQLTGKQHFNQMLQAYPLATNSGIVASYEILWVLAEKVNE